MDTSETTIYHAVIIGCILIGGLFVFLGIVIFRTQRIFFKEQQARYLAEVSLLEKERTRIARDLHDELGPILTLTDIQISEAVKDKSGSLDLLKLAQHNIKTTNKRLGEIANNLTPGSLNRKGFDFAIQEFLGQIELTKKIKIDYRFEVTTNIPKEVSLQLFRMIQELVNNAIKHSNASSIVVQLKERKKKLYVLCRDNGMGMEVVTTNALSTGKGIGINSMKNRAALLGGKMHYASRNGTEYFFELPLNLYQNGQQHANSNSG